MDAHPTFMVRTIARVISETRIHVSTEEAAQREIYDLLLASEFVPEREVVIEGSGRIDLMVDGIGIEVKIGGDKRSTYGQIKRYVASDQIEGLILATNGAWPARGPQMDGKPFAAVNLGAAWL